MPVGVGSGVRRMSSFRIGLFAAALLCPAAVPARAQGFISPFAGYNFGGNSANCAIHETALAQSINSIELITRSKTRL